MTSFDVITWDARQNARRHRAEVRRRTVRIEQAERFAAMSKQGIGDAVRAYADEYTGFAFCAVVAAAV